MKVKFVILALLLVGVFVTAIAPVSAMIPPNPPPSLPPQWYNKANGEAVEGGIADQNVLFDEAPEDVIPPNVPGDARARNPPNNSPW